MFSSLMSVGEKVESVSRDIEFFSSGNFFNDNILELSYLL